jgi:hypothetical protein
MDGVETIFELPRPHVGFGTGFVSQDLNKGKTPSSREEEMTESTCKLRVFWSAFKSLVTVERVIPQDIVLKTGREDEFDLTLLLATKETNLSIRLARSA